MQFRLSSLLLAFVVVAMSLAVFGAAGVVAAPVLLAVVAHLRQSGSPRRALAKLGVACALVPSIVIALQELVSHAQFAAKLAACSCPLGCSIKFGLSNYQSTMGSMPPAHTTDQDGRPLHSWRVLLLPYIEEHALHQSLQLREPWDAPANSAAKTPLRSYRCPADKSRRDEPLTNYVAIVGSHSPWGRPAPASAGPGKEPLPNPAIVAEVIDAGIQWAEPRDMTLDEACRGINAGQSPCISSAHGYGNYLFRREPLGANILFADGTIHFIPTATPPDLLRRVLSGEPGSLVEVKPYRGRVTWRVEWVNCAALAGLIASLFAMLLLPRR